jgi:hypothetical protein
MVASLYARRMQLAQMPVREFLPFLGSVGRLRGRFAAKASFPTPCG